MAKRKKRSKTSDFVQYIGLRAFVFIIQLLPLDISMLLGKSLAYASYLIDKKHRKVADENLRNAYGESLSDVQRRKIIRGNYLHLASVGVNFIKFSQIVDQNNWQKHFEVEGLEFVRKAHKEGKGIIFVSGHLGNWEVVGLVMGFLHFPPHSIAKHMENPFVDRFITRYRKRTGQKVIFTENATRKILRVLKNNEFLGIVADQNVRENNIFVDFFGQKASTTKAVATLSLKTGASIIMVFLRQIDGRYRFKLSLSQSVEIKKTGDLEKDILNLTQKYTSMIESRIREYPHEWLWIHRRWKKRPPIVSGQ